MVGLAAYFVRAGLILGWLFTGLALVQLLVIVRVTRNPRMMRAMATALKVRSRVGLTRPERRRRRVARIGLLALVILAVVAAFSAPTGPVRTFALLVICATGLVLYGWWARYSARQARQLLTTAKDRGEF